MENKINEQDSLLIINEMIARAKDNIKIGAANAMITAGYSVAVIAILNIILLNVLPQPGMSFWVWTLMIPVSFVNMLIDRRQDKSAIVKTHIDRIIGATWSAFGYSVSFLLVVIFGMVFALNTWVFTILITPSILILMGLAQYVMAIASRYKPFYWGSYVFWIGSVLCVLSVLLLKNTYLQFVILAACVVVGFCIPGHMLNSKAKKNV